jgi:HSP20 family protein
MSEVEKMWNDEIFEEIRQMQRQMGGVCCESGLMHPVLVPRDMLDEKQTGKETAPAGAMQFWRAPRCDVTETDDSIVSAFELPGADKSDIELNVNDDAIEVKVEKKQENVQKGDESYHSMSARQSFYRHIPLPKNVDASKATAEYKNGILRVEVPKAAKAKAKRLEIK